MTRAARDARAGGATAQLGLALQPTPTRKRRRSVGRPRIHREGEAPHGRRARITRHQPVHVVLRTTWAARELRRRDAYGAMKVALYTTFKREDFRVCQVSLQTGHVHLIVEADDHVALARGMQGLQISCARRVNRVLSRRAGRRRSGRVFADRYYIRVQRSPRQMRNTLAYVLGNWRKHGGDRGAMARFDPYSSGPLFDGWRERRLPVLLPVGLDVLPVALPHSWMLSIGWRRCGLLEPGGRPQAGRPRPHPA